MKRIVFSAFCKNFRSTLGFKQGEQKKKTGEFYSLRTGRN
jgi:hypothetical protein